MKTKTDDEDEDEDEDEETTVGAATANLKPRLKVHLQNNVIYLGDSPKSPHIGDVKIEYKNVAAQTVGIIAKVDGDTFAPFISAHQREYSEILTGAVSAEELFAKSAEPFDIWHWFWRIVGPLLTMWGVKRNVAEMSNSFSKPLPIGCGCGAIILGSVFWSLLIIGAAWWFFNFALSTEL